MNFLSSFTDLTPERILGAVETAIGCRLTGLTAPMPSYINRVYEVLSVEDQRFVVKFYRPGRWTVGAIENEHCFVQACFDAEIPVVPPLCLNTGKTIGQTGDIYFAVFPKRSGREMELLCDEDWRRMGRIVARIHVAAAGVSGSDRRVLHPEASFHQDLTFLMESDLLPSHLAVSFRAIVEKIGELSVSLFSDIETLPVHGDCHLKNFLHRPDDGLMVIDFDDMMVGPPIQDIWLLLPDLAENSRRELSLILTGYDQFREFDDRSIRLIEPLRAMRMLYFLAWCARQAHDHQFQTRFPNWGTQQFWQSEITDLERQHEIIQRHLRSSHVFP